MPDPQAGDFAVIRTNDWTGRLIRWWTRSDYNHAAFFVSPTQVVEAEPKGAQLTNWSRYAGRADGGCDAEVATSAGMWLLTDEQRVAAFPVGMAMVGTPYNWLDILSVGLLQWGIKPRWVRNRVRSSQTLICSQLVDACRTALGDHLFQDGRLPMDVTPGDLAHLIGRR